MSTFDAIEIGNWLRAAPGVDVREFAERLMSRLSDRELGEMKAAGQGIRRARKLREERLKRERAAKAKREQHITLARQFYAACQRALP